MTDAEILAETRAFNEQLEQLLATMPKVHELPAEATRQARLEGRGPFPPLVYLDEARTITIPGRGGEIPLRIIEAPDPQGAYLHLHGGGWTIGTADGQDPLLAEIAQETGLTAVSVDYRLAPEHKFPAAIDDGVAALDWVAANGASLGGDPARLALVGDSAGGNVAAVVAQLAHQAGGPPVAFQMLIYPVTDLRGDTQSFVDNASGYGLSAEAMRWYVEQYVRTEADVLDPRGSPLLAKSLAGLPPAFVAVCEYDPLRDEGKQYTHRMRDAGIDVTLRRYDGAIHGVFQMSRFTAIGARVLDDCVDALRGAIGSPTRPEVGG